jgi:hypothetical protein
MKVIIAGTRTLFPSLELMDACIQNCGFNVTEIVEGGAPGVDTVARDYANVMDIPVKEFEAKWDQYGGMAGPMRNREMAQYADALILIWDGNSPGSKSMKKIAMELNLPIYEHIISRTR